MSPALQHANAATTNVGMIGMPTHIAFVVPATLALAAACAAHFDHSKFVVLAGQQLGPGFATDLQLRDQ